MLIHPQFSPEVFSLGPIDILGHSFGPLAVRWYGLMYLIAFLLFVWMGKRRARGPLAGGWTPLQVDDLLFYGVLGVILGGRLGYVVFYKLDYYLANPTEILAVWQGGMSFHGGFIGVLVALWCFGRKTGKDFFTVSDFVAPLVPLGLAAGRLGNFINGELWGRPTDPSAPWAMVFPQVDALPRHPSQLYEMGLEGLMLFVILWWFSAKTQPKGATSAIFLIGYGLARFTVEFAREPDSFLGLQALGLSRGQWLSLPMILSGVAMLVWAKRKT